MQYDMAHNLSMTSTPYDFAIVGGGMAGASLAFRLAASSRVVLLERESQPGYHTTGRSAAMFMESYGPAGVRALTRASRDFYTSPPLHFAEKTLLRPRGALYVARHDQADALRAMAEELRQSIPNLEHLTAEQSLALAPCLRPENLLGALWDPDSQDIDVNALLQGFLKGFKLAGGTLQCNADLSEAKFDRNCWSLRLKNGAEVQAKCVVNASGAWGDEVAMLMGAKPIGLIPRRRSAFTFKAPEGVAIQAWPAVVGIEEDWYFKPDAGQLFGSPANADDTFPHDVLPEQMDIAIGIDRIMAATNLEIKRPSSQWAGLRTFAPDGEMVIGFDDACPQLFWLVGQGGYGIQSAAGYSSLAACLLQRQELTPDLIACGVDARMFDVHRFRTS